MMGMAAALFTTAIELSGGQRFLLMLPLCLSISIVYKTMRCDDLRAVPMSALILWATIVAGMCAVGAGLWLLFTVLV